VVVITTKWNSDYPAAAQKKRGKEVGLPMNAVEATAAGLPTSFPDPREQVMYGVAVSLANNRIGRRRGPRSDS